MNALSELENFVGARARAVQRDVRHLKASLFTTATHVQGVSAMFAWTNCPSSVAFSPSFLTTYLLFCKDLSLPHHKPVRDYGLVENSRINYKLSRARCTAQSRYGASSCKYVPKNFIISP